MVCSTRTQHTHTPHTSQHHTHLHRLVSLGWDVDGWSFHAPQCVWGLSLPSLSPPLAAAAVHWLWLRQLGCQEGRGTPRGHPQQLDNRSRWNIHNITGVSCQWGSGGKRGGRGKNTKDLIRERVGRIELHTSLEYHFPSTKHTTPPQCNLHTLCMCTYTHTLLCVKWCDARRTHPTLPRPLLWPRPPCWKVQGPTVLLCGGSLRSSNSITPPATITARMSTSPSSRRGSSSSSPSPGVGDTVSGGP